MISRYTFLGSHYTMLIFLKGNSNKCAQNVFVALARGTRVVNMQDKQEKGQKLS